ncbi:MAG: riboflavin synthase [Parvibaculales bacterium]
MFSGIVDDIGEVLEIAGKEEKTFKIACNYPHGQIKMGASIACHGICLSVIDKGEAAQQSWFSVNVTASTLAVTNAGQWKEKSRLHLERALKMGDEIGGHMVSGHIDGLAEIIKIEKQESSNIMHFSASEKYISLIASKGSITLNGTSLTVNEIEKKNFTITLIPHTLETTLWAEAKEGDKVNLEIDIFARTIARILEEKT